MQSRLARSASLFLPLLVSLITGCGSKNGAGSDGGGSDSGTVDAPGAQDAPHSIIDAAPMCGNGILESGETCDDGNAAGSDGCSANCQPEPGYVCGNPGDPCVIDHGCGNGLLEDTETCDDHNTTDGDGCSASCQIEAGWACAVPGIRCTAAMCGDGILAGFEQCDDHNTASGDGCSAACQLEPGFACVGTTCHATTCGDGVAEGTEECDDGSAAGPNNDLGDGCDPFCHREPQCTNGTCLAVCGDGVLQTGEGCDDGNLTPGDGCARDCTVETGFKCAPVTGAAPPTFAAAIVYRDFRGLEVSGGHPDFQNHNGDDRGINTTAFGADHKPVYDTAAHASTSTTAGQARYDQWYRDTPGENLTVLDTLTLANTPAAPHTYVFDTKCFFPLDGKGFTALGTEPTFTSSGCTTPTANHNFNFTSELHYWFTYAGGEVLTFRGDDDVWVFVNGARALDLGGVHGPETGSVTVDNLGLTVGGTYEVVVLQAERHTSGSNYRLTLAGFDAPRSACTDMCGDGVTSSNEVCDDGINMGGYDSCAPGCLAFGPRCGDGVVQADHEQCDDGTNVGGYGHCLPTCQLGPRCGDGIVQGDKGETCDDANSDNTDGCANCQLVIM